MKEENLDQHIHEVLSGQDSIPLPAELTKESKEEGVGKSLYGQIQRMTVIEKIKLALKGNKETRTLLLRDSNRIVQNFVLQNPRITEEEITALACNRNTEGELLRRVADNREWIKYYPVRLGLTGNPRTPLAIALHLLPPLRERDIRDLARSKNVPIAVSTQAKRLILQRGRKRS